MTWRPDHVELLNVQGARVHSAALQGSVTMLPRQDLDAGAYPAGPGWDRPERCGRVVLPEGQRSSRGSPGP